MLVWLQAPLLRSPIEFWYPIEGSQHRIICLSLALIGNLTLATMAQPSLPVCAVPNITVGY